MKSELVVDINREEVSIALIEDSRLVSLQKESRNIAYAVGDIYLAKVKKIMPGLNAAFVDVGYEKDAFLHYLDLGPQFSTYMRFIRETLEDKKKVPGLSKFQFDPDIPKQGSIADVLKAGDQLLVQIAKEPISTKGPRLTTELSLTGRFMVLMPFGDKISISQKIKSTEEKIRLRQLISSIKPKGFSVIVRTSAENKRVAELNNEMRTLVKSWGDMLAKTQRAKAPALVYQEDSRILSMIRDLFAPNFENIYVNDKETFEQIKKYVALIAPEKEDIVKLYSKEVPIFDHFNITRQIKSSFGKTVSFKSGAYIIIESTEALHVVDVNSGNRSKASPDQESNALDVNLAAADEIARQLRLRDMGGIIVVDFIDMAKQEHRQALFDHMREVMANDRARHNILPLSKFGLMQITRQRVRPSLSIVTAETCPSCFGKGEVQASILFTDKLEEKIEYLVEHLKVKKFTMYIHPFVEAYVKKGLFSLYSKWRRHWGRGVKIVADESLAYLQYKVFDADKNEIDLKEESDINSSQSKNKQKIATRNEVRDDDNGQTKKEQAKKEQQVKGKNNKQQAPESKECSSRPKPQNKKEKIAVSEESPASTPASKEKPASGDSGQKQQRKERKSNVSLPAVIEKPAEVKETQPTKQEPAASAEQKRRGRRRSSRPNAAEGNSDKTATPASEDMATAESQSAEQKPENLTNKPEKSDDA